MVTTTAKKWLPGDSKALIHPTVFQLKQLLPLSVTVFGNMNEASPLPEKLYSSKSQILFFFF